MTQKFKAKNKSKTDMNVEEEKKIIHAFFHRPLEALRIIYGMDGELRADVAKKISEELDIARGTANDHIKAVLEANFFTLEEDGRLYKTDRQIKWLWSYLLPLYPRREREALKTMLFHTSTKFNKMELAKTEVYTKRIEDTICDAFGHELDGKTLKKIVSLIWNVFGDEKIKTDLY